MLNVAEESCYASPLPLPSRPSGAVAAYGAVIRGTEDPRVIEYRVLARATNALLAALLPGAGTTALPKALHDNRMVWTAFAADLADDGNSWEPPLRASLLSLAAWVFQESDRVLWEGKPPQALIDINRAVMSGLQPNVTPQPGPI